MVTSFRRSHAGTATLRAPSPAAGHRRPTPPPETPGHSQQVWVSLLWGRCSFLMGPGAQGSVCALQESVSQSCVSSGGPMVGLMATSSKRAYAICKCPVPRALSLQHSTADSYLHRRHSNTVLSQSLWGPWVLVHTRFA